MKGLKLVLGRLISMLLGLVALAGMGHNIMLADQPSGTPSVFVVLVDVSGSMDDPFPAPVQTRLKDSTKLHDVRRRLGLLAEHLPTRTKVIAYTFDHRVTKIFDDELRSDHERGQLAKKFGDIRTDGGTTFLWRTLDQGLNEAKQLIESPEHARVRVLLYSDGKDEEKKYDQNTILAKYGAYLKDNVQVDWMCIGYDLETEVKSQLSDAGVRFVQADIPEKLDVVVAAFSLDHDTATVGQMVTVVNQSYSTGAFTSHVTWGDGSPLEALQSSATHVYQTPGSFTVRVEAKGSHSSEKFSRTVVVSEPPLVKAKLKLDKHDFTIGDRMVATDISGAPAKSVQWLFNEKVVGDQSVLTLPADRVGTATLELKRIDSFDRSSSDNVEIVIRPPAAPQISFRTVGEKGKVGETFFCFNESTANATTFEWYANDQLVSREKHLEWTPATEGEFKLLLRGTDPWKQTAQATRNVLIAPKLKVSAKLVDPGKIEAGNAIVFNHASTGPVEKVVWLLNGQKLAQTAAATWSSVPGEHELVLEVHGDGLSDRATHRFQVPLPRKPEAVFRTSTPEPTSRTRVAFLNDSPPSAVSFQWVLNGKVVSDQRNYEFTPIEPGDYRIELLAADRWQQTSSSQMVLNVLPLAKPTISLVAPNVIDAGTKLAAVCNIVGQYDQTSLVWKLDGRPLSTKQARLELEALSAGHHELVAEVSSLAGSVSEEHRFEVKPYAKPVGRLSLSSEQLFKGDVLRLIDQSTGSIDSIRIRIHRGDGTEPQAFELNPTIIRTIDWPCEDLGGIRVEHVVTGPGGTVVNWTEATVSSRFTPPRARFSPETAILDGTLNLRLVNQCEGDVAYFEVDAGDGAPTQRFEPTQPIVLNFGPGLHHVRVTAFSAEPSFAPSVWTSETFHVPTPWPTWVLALLWVIPLSVVCAAGVWWAVQSFREQSLLNRASMLSGELQVHPIGRPFETQNFAFYGNSVEETVALDPNTTLRLTCLNQVESGEIEVELLIDGVSQATRTCAPGESNTIGDYEYLYTAAPAVLA
ncbi:MAG: hypothetical protein JNL67_07505 [Planctomycetaceae bacterium]|nr:hypothetical protein [Planctomycetaceae bacterium]